MSLPRWTCASKISASRGSSRRSSSSYVASTCCARSSAASTKLESTDYDSRPVAEVLICKRLEITSAVVPAEFPLRAAERLSEAGVEVRSDRELFDARRRVKSEAELAGIRRAQRAAEQGMDIAREHLRRGAGVTSEEIKAAIERHFTANGMVADEFIVSHGPQSAIGHHMGSGPIAEGESVVVDLWPRDRETGCYADMTRTFVIGEPPAELVEWHGLVKQAVATAIRAISAGVH